MSYNIPVPRSRHPEGPLGRLDIHKARATRDQRGLRRHGLRGFQPGTTAALLTLWELAPRPLQFLDVGANGGLYSWLCKAVHADAHVSAFEPAPVASAALRRICEANSLEVTCHPVAVGAAAGESTLYLSAKSDASNSLVRGFRRAVGEVRVPVVALDDHVATHGLVPDVVKIDVEGYEEAALAGASRLLTEHRPAIVIELLPTHAERADRARTLLEEAGYRGRLIDISHFPHRRDVTMRDWVFFPGSEPANYERHYLEWSEVVARCGPATGSAATAASKASSTS
jgi:FkbM family methyltransferase